MLNGAGRAGRRARALLLHGRRPQSAGVVRPRTALTPRPFLLSHQGWARHLASAATTGGAEDKSKQQQQQKRNYDKFKRAAGGQDRVLELVREQPVNLVVRKASRLAFSGRWKGALRLTRALRRQSEMDAEALARGEEVAVSDDDGSRVEGGREGGTTGEADKGSRRNATHRIACSYAPCQRNDRLTLVITSPASLAPVRTKRRQGCERLIASSGLGPASTAWSSTPSAWPRTSPRSR